MPAEYAQLSRLGLPLLFCLSALASCGLNPLQGPMLFCGDDSYFLVLNEGNTVTVYKEGALHSDRETVATQMEWVRITEHSLRRPEGIAGGALAVSFVFEGIETTLFVDEVTVTKRNDGQVRGRFAARQMGGADQSVEQCMGGFQTS